MNNYQNFGSYAICPSQHYFINLKVAWTPVLLAHPFFGMHMQGFVFGTKLCNKQNYATHAFSTFLSKLGSAIIDFYILAQIVDLLLVEFGGGVVGIRASYLACT